MDQIPFSRGDPANSSPPPKDDPDLNYNKPNYFSGAVKTSSNISVIVNPNNKIDTIDKLKTFITDKLKTHITGSRIDPAKVHIYSNKTELTSENFFQFTGGNPAFFTSPLRSRIDGIDKAEEEEEGASLLLQPSINIDESVDYEGPLPPESSSTSTSNSSSSTPLPGPTSTPITPTPPKKPYIEDEPEGEVRLFQPSIDIQESRNYDKPRGGGKSSSSSTPLPGPTSTPITPTPPKKPYIEEESVGKSPLFPIEESINYDKPRSGGKSSSSSSSLSSTPPSKETAQLSSTPRGKAAESLEETAKTLPEVEVVKSPENTGILNTLADWWYGKPPTPPSPPAS